MLTTPRNRLKQGVKARVEGALNALAADPMLLKDHAAELSIDDDSAKKAILAEALRRLAGLGIVSEQKE